MMMKSGLGKIFLKFLHALNMSFLSLNFDQKYKFIFRPEMLKFYPYSILTGDTRVEFVIYLVLKALHPNPHKDLLNPLVLMKFVYLKQGLRAIFYLELNSTPLLLSK